MQNSQIIILAGGEGKRMGGLMPKVLINLNSKPLIRHLLNSIERCNFSLKPLVVVGFKGELVKEELKDEVIYAVQNKQLGTGHAVLCAKGEVSMLSKNVIVLYGDMPNISSDTINRLLNIHEKENPKITMMTIKVPDFLGNYAGFKGFGKIIRSNEGEIKKIVEARDAEEEEKNITELNPGLFCFNSVWLWQNLPKLNSNNAQGEFYLTDLVGMAMEEGQKISSLEIDPMECIGVNTPDELKFAEQILAQQL